MSRAHRKDSVVSATVIRCADCASVLEERSLYSTCPSCGGLLVAEHRMPALKGAALRALFDDRTTAEAHRGTAMHRSGVWRFRELVLPDAGDNVVSHPEGNTPLIDRDAISRYAGVASLVVKHEGHNPTGSFKDRGMTVAVTQAKRIGARAVACASTGNTSASLSAYAAQAEIPSFVFVPEGRIAAGKLAQTVAYGAHTLRIKGDFDDCLRLAREASEKLGVYLVNSVNPYRIEGQKTIVFELLQQLGWEAPDWIALPAGNLGNTSAFGKALVEAFHAGLIDRMPRLLAVQAAGAAPFAQAFVQQFASRLRVQAETRATAIRIGDPASWDRAVGAITATNGIVESVTDEEIFAAKKVIDECGVGCEPASAASVAGVRALVASGLIGRDERVVAVLTGHLLKDPGVDASAAMSSDALTPAEALTLLERVVAS
ncbi:MAG: threonine synthase [Gemmatimonadota bacterium]|nr:threonine synthase [Gemmatimonadota bacterium]